ncbi:MAG: NADH-quinone oxidoreductase subunit H [Thermoprotei archaeon]|nr:MAG: NADH-quinone oxidoreductase subunit H [Thermoprotei archaeon]
MFPLIEPLLLVFETLVYPGLAFSLIVILLTQWYVRKLYARMQNRVGPLHTGPSGLLQPLADFLKLMFKEDVAMIGGGDKLVAVLLTIAVGSLIALLLMTPLTLPLRALLGLHLVINAPFDIILALYLLVWPTVAIALAGLLSPNPFSIVGGSRVFSLTIAYEVVLALSVLTPVALISLLHGGSYSLYEASMLSWKLWLHPYTAALTSIALFTALLGLQCKLLEKPFDIPEAETEIVAGPFTEYSGPKLALILLLHDLELYVGSAIITFLFLGGPAPFFRPLWAAALTFLVKYLAVISVLTMIKAAVARFRVDQALGLFWRYVLPVALIALVLSIASPVVAPLI